MGAIGIVALVIVVLIVSAIGFQNLLAAIGVAIVFALFLRYITDEYYKFSEGFSGAIVSLGIAGILSIFIDVEFWGFWIAYIVVLLFWGFSLNHNVVKIEKEAQPVLKELQDFLEDYSHFMQDHYRFVSVYWSEGDMNILLYVLDAEIEQDIYREYREYRKSQKDDVDPTTDSYLLHFFDGYKPISKHYYQCYLLLEEGTHEFGEDSLVYRWKIPVYENESGLSPVIRIRMQEKYPSSFRKGTNDVNFTIKFEQTK